MNVDNKPNIGILNQSGEEALSNLNGILQLLHQMAGAQYAGLYFKRVLLVIDANAVISDLRAYGFSGRKTDLQLCLEHKTFAAIAPTQLEKEVCKHIPSIADEIGADKIILLDAWSQLYKPHIQFLNDIPDNASELINTLRDSSDKPYVQAYESHKADAVLSSDPDIKVLQITPSRSPQFVMDLRRYAERKSIQLQVVFGGMAFTFAGVAAIVGLCKLIYTLIQKYPVFGYLGLAGLLFYAMSSKTQNKLSDFGIAFRSTLKDLWNSPEIEQLLNAFVESHQMEQQIQSALPQSQKPKVLKEYVRRALAEAVQPMTIDEIQRQVEFMGYDSKAKHAKTYLRSVLKKLPEVMLDSTGRWALRRVI